jgi:hypothetical protein
MRSSTSVHEPPVQETSTQIHRRFFQTNRHGRPWLGRSTSSTAGRSFTRATTPHVGKADRLAFVSTCSRIADVPPISIPRNLISGKPTNSSIARVGSVSTGILHLSSLNNLRLVDSRYAFVGSGYVTPFISATWRVPMTSETRRRAICQPSPPRM